MDGLDERWPSGLALRRLGGNGAGAGGDENRKAEPGDVAHTAIMNRARCDCRARLRVRPAPRREPGLSRQGRLLLPGVIAR